ncbi:divergent polysaccharide deacetylase family protein [Pseudorhodobacter sp. E13]|uniref:divergent polysaccharide deacetylase family protein n=1 Tax=Pseudorhodobacter sp. E13 TaxID=2487931 RepID=UPI000F8ECDD6|nr:divergent polysaccharide deacetylase family protein [Pseudorhodobacter sp. E13]RUS60048.1 divergent polysaccharide deacetylase family protein [Pseudorhodobacter sp. E13]
MSRGFLSGAAWGTVVAGFGLVVASQMANVSGTELADAPTEAQPVAVEVAEQAKSLDAAQAPKADPAVAPVDKADVPATETVVAALPQDAATSAAQDAAPSQPLDAAPDFAATAAGSGAAPMVPAPSGSASVPKQPQGLAPDTAGADPAPDTQTVAIPEVQTTAPNAAAPAALVPAPDVPNVVEVPPVQTDSRVAELPDRSLADTAPEGADLPPPAPEMVAADMAKPEQAEEEIVIVVDEAMPPEADPAPDQVAAAAPARPEPGFVGKVEGVRTGRLPSITSATEAAPAPAADVAQGNGGAAALVVDDASLPAIDRFARAFENPENKPLFTILLQDTGGPDVDREALAKIPFPVSFVIDPTQADAALAAKIYREAGQEVLMLVTGIPAGANASDLSVSFEAMQAALPEAVAVVDMPSGGFQGNRTLAAQVLALVADQGRGVMTWDRGLNAASQIARRDGMRSAVIFRALDAEGESAPIIRRYLDRAAFKAAQDGRVVVAGQTRPETVAALLEWAVEGRAATVAIAPSSAAMTAQ